MVVNNMDSLYLRIQALSNELATLEGIEKQISDALPDVQDDVFCTAITDTGLKKKVEKLFRDGHHARAVEEAFKYLDNVVKKKSGDTSDSSGAALMTRVFSANSPVLKINSMNTRSEKDEQLGYMNILQGCMTGIRNPRAHESDWEDTEQHCLELLILANHLIERVRLSTK